jgi:CdiI immunity protein
VTFRRSKDQARQARSWQDFTLSQRHLFDEAGLPGILSEDREAFEYFLMEGFLPMPGGLADGTRFEALELDVPQRDALDRLVLLYVGRFGDPGVSLGPRKEDVQGWIEETSTWERQFPDLYQFFGGRFNQDWDLDAPDDSGVIKRFKSEEPPEFVHAVREQLHALIRLELPEDELQTVVWRDLGCYFDPTYDGGSMRAWVLSVADRLDS